MVSCIIPVISCLLLTVFITFTQAVGITLPNGKRGLARVMELNGEEVVNRGDSLDKRGNRVTWYSGADLRNAACYDRKGLGPFHAKVTDMIGAMAMHNFEQCYKCMEITNNRAKNKKIIVEIVDKCAACKIGTHIDLTPGAFKKLSPGGNLDVGVLDISYKPVKCPSFGLPKLPSLHH